MILSCQNLKKAFGTVSVIREASFHIEDREKAALVGETVLANLHC